MKQNWVKFLIIAFTAAVLVPGSLWAQKEEKEKTEKEKVSKEMRQIIVTTKGDKDEKVVIEVKGDKVTVNGKPLEDYKDENGNIKVHVNKWKDFDAYTVFGRGTRNGGWTMDNKDAFTFQGLDENRAMLGVSTTKADNGVQVESVVKESGAEKAGLKENDVITKIDDIKIEEPDDLSNAVQKHKPGDKVTITYLRDKKEQKTTAELGKSKFGGWSIGPDKQFKMNMGETDLKNLIARTPGSTFSWSGGSPKLGLSVQDSDDGKGVKVIGVDDESNAAKAGIKENDIILEADSKTINNADDIVKVIRESKEKISIMLKIQRDGKTQNVEVKMPRKLKTANL